MTGYAQEEGTQEPASKLTRKTVGPPRKAKESPIFIAHNHTNAAFGGGQGFSKSINTGVIHLELCPLHSPDMRVGAIQSRDEL